MCLCETHNKANTGEIRMQFHHVVPAKAFEGIPCMWGNSLSRKAKPSHQHQPCEDSHSNSNQRFVLIKSPLNAGTANTN